VKTAKWLNKELETAAEQYEAAAAELRAAGFDLANRDFCLYQRDYWSGYADALTNVINELAGAGDTN
jgi:hypothetical protein